MSPLNYSEQVAVALSVFALVFSIAALAFTWWISRPVPPAQDDPHKAAAE
jgi:hypothetical protein